ncbi:diguanylate cyclase, partial [bacterium]|nr:diguanylate cyclase [candidate division CSSED10-310 bacterium]
MNSQGQVSRDPLTNVLSRKCFVDQFQKYARKIKGKKSNVSVILFDLDHFKSINDAFGHQRGDAVLIEFVKRLKGNVRSRDSIFRFGGDEFLLLLPHMDRFRCLDLATRILESVKQSEFSGDPPLTITVSSGIASFPEDGEKADEVFHKADIRLLEAKRKGRSQIVHLDPEQTQRLPFDEISRLVDRDNELSLANHYLRQLDKKECGVLSITGPRGSGRSRFLMEIAYLARLKGFTTLIIRGSSPRIDHYSGEFSFTEEGFFSACKDNLPDTEISSRIETACDQKNIEKIMILVDDWRHLDLQSKNALRLFMSHSERPVRTICAVVDSGSDFSQFFPEIGFKDAIELKRISRRGLSIWIRNLLQWDPPDDFISWMINLTKGLPSLVKSVMTSMIEKGYLLQESKHSWRFNRAYEEIVTDDIIGFLKEIPPHNLPSNITGFIGRDEELKQTGTMLQKQRLVTIVGPGGIGKTRLALQIAEKSLTSFPDGVFFIALTPVSSPEYVPAVIADALQFSFYSPIDPLKQLLNYLRERKVLLLMDNFDQIVDGACIVSDLL